MRRKSCQETAPVIPVSGPITQPVPLIGLMCRLSLTLSLHLYIICLKKCIYSIESIKEKGGSGEGQRAYRTDRHE